MLACQGRRDLRSNDLFDRANQRVVGLIGRVRMRNSPYGRAQRGRTINIPNGYFPIFCAILIYLIENEKRKLHYNIKHNQIIAIGYFVVIRT